MKLVRIQDSDNDIVVWVNPLAVSTLRESEDGTEVYIEAGNTVYCTKQKFEDVLAQFQEA